MQGLAGLFARRTPPILWATLLRARGAALWLLRHDLAPKEDGTSAAVSLGDGILLLRAVQEFATLERVGALIKVRKAVHEADGLPLTYAMGECWRRQRTAITKVLPHALAADRVECAAERCGALLVAALSAAIAGGSGDSVVLDLKSQTEHALSEWIVEIAAGVTSDATQALRSTFLAHWRALRYGASSADGGVARAARDEEQLVQPHHLAFRHAARLACDASSSCGLAAGLRAAQGDGTGEQPSLARSETAPNLCFGMVAGFETTLSLVMWTLVEVGAPQRAELRAHLRAACRRCDGAAVANPNPDPDPGPGPDPSRRSDGAAVAHMQEQAALETLRSLKQRAVAGEAINATALANGDGELHPLVPALLETLRCYPPVWSLPRDVRTLRKGGRPAARFARGDVLSMNGATARDWDPHVERPPMPLASFGVGERHCPAGGSGLVAAFIVLRQVLASFEFEEAVAGHAVASTRLAPTLVMDGPQYFRVKRAV